MPCVALITKFLIVGLVKLCMHMMRSAMAPDFELSHVCVSEVISEIGTFNEGSVVPPRNSKINVVCSVEYDRLEQCTIMWLVDK